MVRSVPYLCDNNMFSIKIMAFNKKHGIKRGSF